MDWIQLAHLAIDSLILLVALCDRQRDRPAPDAGVRIGVVEWPPEARSW